jgi:hypothetical protein
MWAIIKLLGLDKSIYVRKLGKFMFNLIHKNDVTKIIMTSYMCLFNHIIIMKNIIVLTSKT